MDRPGPTSGSREFSQRPGFQASILRCDGRIGAMALRASRFESSPDRMGGLPHPRRFGAILVLAVLSFSYGGSEALVTTPAPQPEEPLRLELEQVVTGLTNPVDLQEPPDGSSSSSSRGRFASSKTGRWCLLRFWISPAASLPEEKWACGKAPQRPSAPSRPGPWADGLWSAGRQPWLPSRPKP